MLSILIGHSISKGDIFSYIWLFISMTCIIGLIVVFGVIDSIKKTNYVKYPGLALLVLVLSAVYSVSIDSIRYNEKLEAQKKLIIYLDSVKQKNGLYPISIKNYELDREIKDISYSTDSIRQNFYLMISLDGWNNQYYDTHTRSWEVMD